MHALIVIPYYFFLALALLSALMLVARLLRLKVSINVLVGIAIAAAVAGVGIPLACRWITLAAFTSRPMIVIAVVSLVLAAVDAVLARRLPLHLDEELHDL